MNQALEQIRDQQRETWNRFSPGWKKWDDFTMAFLRPMGDAIVAALRLIDGQSVLDVAAGTGEPGLTIATAFPRSTVVGTDLADGMLRIAAARARECGLANYRTEVADVSALPFHDAAFDAVSCRMGFMFFPDMALAAREIARVLRAGGRFSTSVWNAGDRNPWVTTMMAAIQRHVALPPVVSGAPGMFRCAAPGLLAQLLHDVGFVDVTEQDVSGSVSYENPEQYWTMMLDVAAPVVAVLSKLDAATRARIKAEASTALQSAGGTISLGYSARVVSGRKP